MKYNGIIEEKLGDILNWDINSFEQFSRSSLLQSAAERALQVAIEVMIDVSERILALEKVPPQNSVAQNISQLQKMKIISNNPEYAEMVKFRNLIVHRYEKIDPEIVYSIVKNKLPFFESFIADIRNS